MDTTGADLSAVERKVSLKKSVRAPVKKGKKVGEAAYYLNGAEIGKVDILTAEAVKEVSLGSVMGDMVKRLLL